MALHYPLLINPPKEINITGEQFDHLSFMGIASLFCSFEYVVKKTDTGYRIYMGEGHEHRFYGKPRFKGTKWFSHGDAEMVSCEIPIGNPLIESINKYFPHLIMK